MQCPHGLPCGSHVSNQGVDGWQGTAWLVERLYPHRFSRPELQISLQNTFNQTTNALSIVISKEEAQQIEEEAEKSRVKVREMIAAYRPAALGNGNGFQSQDAMVSESVRQKFAAYRPSTPMP